MGSETLVVSVERCVQVAQHHEAEMDDGVAEGRGPETAQTDAPSGELGTRRLDRVGVRVRDEDGLPWAWVEFGRLA